MLAAGFDWMAFGVGAGVAATLVLWTTWRRQRTIRRHALNHSRAVLKGQVAEQLVPLAAEFPYPAADARFLGHPVDYVVFAGHGDGGPVEIVLVEVKTGNARLSPGEKRIRDAVNAGRVRFAVLRR